MSCGEVAEKEFLYKPLKKDWRGYVARSANDLGNGAISSPDYFSADFQRRVKYEFANRVDYSFLRGNTSKTGYNNNYNTKA